MKRLWLPIYLLVLLAVPSTLTAQKTVGHHGSSTPGPVVKSVQTPVQDFALSFDGSTNYVSVPPSSTWAFGTGDFTVEWWQYQTDNHLYTRVLAVGPEPETFGISIENYFGDMRLFCWLGGSCDVSATVVNYKNEWVHFAVTRSSGTVNIYENGSLVGTGTNTGDANNSTDSLYIGREKEPSSAAYFGGNLDEIRIWNVAHTQSDIQSTMYTELFGDESGLVAYYRMTDGAGNQLTDNAIPGINTGTIVGATWIVSTHGVLASQIPGNWSSTSTWRGGVVPSATGNVVINNDITIDASTTCHSISINPGARLICGADLNVKQGFSMVAGSTFLPNQYRVRFGTGLAASMISVTPDTWFYDLEIDDSLNVSLAADLRVRKSVQFTYGKLFTTGHNLILGSDASLVNESETSNIEGEVQTVKTIGTEGIANWAGLGVDVSAGSDDIGAITIFRTTGVNAVQTVNGKSGIKSTWRICVENAITQGRDFTFRWFPEFDNGKNLSTAHAWAKPDDESSWSDVSGSAQDASSHMITFAFAHPTNGSSSFTVSDEASPLPIQLSSFTAGSTNGTSVKLHWGTVSEVNNYGFMVYRSASLHGVYTQVSPLIPGYPGGNTVAPQSYQWIDNTPNAGDAYYRLRQYDMDNSFHDYEPIQVNLALMGVNGYQVAPKVFQLMPNFPNPFNPSTIVKFTVEKSAPTTLVVYNTLGQEVITLFNGPADAGRYYAVKFDANRLSSGAYFCRLISGTQNTMIRMALVK